MTKYLQFLQNQLELIAGYKAQTELPLLAVRYMNTVVELLILQFYLIKYGIHFCVVPVNTRI